MKLWTLLTSLGTAAALCVFAMSANAALPTLSATSVANSRHNLNKVWGDNTVQENQVCLPCHAPHNTGNSETLWNHTPSANGSYTLWSGAIGLDEGSKMCLSCHDGSVAADSYGNYTFGTGGAASTFQNPTEATNGNPAHKLTGAFQIGASGDLTHDHPVGVAYGGANADGTDKASTRWNPPSTWTTYTYQKLDATNVLATFNYVDATQTPIAVARPLQLASAGGQSNIVGCGTCHTPHRSNYNFLRMPNVNSQMCLSCHIK